MIAAEKCSECGSLNLSWSTQNKAPSSIPEGRLRTNEVQCLFVLGCGECSETLGIISAEALADALTKAR